MKKIASPDKIYYHKSKLAVYLSGNPIFPATLELDITSDCTRSCLDCPSSRSERALYLDLKFISNLMAFLKGETKGLLLTGGEPTMSPDFSKVLVLAREYGFQDIAVVTNGSFLHKDDIKEALVSHASTLRISMYDWENGRTGKITTILKRIESLRERIEKLNSPLQIGISVLTSKERINNLYDLANSTRNSGAHWIYFHPMCTGWRSGMPTQADQIGVLKMLEKFQINQTNLNGFETFFSSNRYKNSGIRFNGYHAANFLIVIGADGLNYLAPEVKYQPQHVVADVAGEWGEDFLWRKDRLKKILAVNNTVYPAIRSRHRGILYSDLIEKLKINNQPLKEDSDLFSTEDFKFPHIL